MEKLTLFENKWSKREEPLKYLKKIFFEHYSKIFIAIPNVYVKKILFPELMHPTV
jgi:hypothetical protein